MTRQNADERAWHVRAALRAGDWPAVLAAVDALPAGMAGRRDVALLACTRARAARSPRRGVADLRGAGAEYNFYGILAAEAIGRRPLTLSTPAPVTTEWLADFGARADVQRVMKLAQLDMRAESVREWYEIVRAMDDETLLKAAEFARRAGLSDRSINAADRTVARHDFALRYPTPYEAQFLAAAKSNNVEAPLLVRHRAPGIALRRRHRVVGRCDGADAADAADGALGVEAARTVPTIAPTRSPRSTPTRSSARSTSSTGSTASMASRRWRPLPTMRVRAARRRGGRRRAIEGAIWVETIPFNETRDYVKKVMANTMFYAAALPHRAAPYVSLTERLGTVRPRNAAAVAQNG